MYIFRQIQQVGPERGEILSFVMAFGIHFQYLERRINLRPGYIPLGTFLLSPHGQQPLPFQFEGKLSVCSKFEMFTLKKCLCIHACAMNSPFHRSMSDALDECMTARMLRLGPG